jgi:hypothetical protein
VKRWALPVVATLIVIPAIALASNYLMFAMGGDCPGLQGRDLTECASGQGAWLLGPLIIGLSAYGILMWRLLKGKE